MDNIYTDPTNPGSFGGIRPLAVAAKASNNKVTKYLESKDSYTLHKKKVRKFKRNRYILHGIDDLWQSDLADMTKFSEQNRGIKFLLVTIDCFSKFLWVQTLKSKNSKVVSGAIQRFLESEDRKPKNWQVDKGGEFRNTVLERMMKENDINFYSIQNPDTKAAFAERVIRTLKDRIYRFFTEKNTWKYVDVLPELVDSYNQSYHRTIGMKPSDVTPEQTKKIKSRIYPPLRNFRVKYKFSIGDSVRLAKEKRSFERGFEQGWTEEIFTVAKRLPRNPPVYKVKDSAGELIEGSFYAQEIQKVSPKMTYKVEKILGTRTRRGTKEYLIKWLGYPENANSWEPEANLTTV